MGADWTLDEAAPGGRCDRAFPTPFLCRPGVGAVVHLGYHGGGGWVGLALLIVGLIILDVAALRWGADSRDGRNWTNGRGLTQGTNRSIDQKFVEAEIARIEHQFRLKG